MITPKKMKREVKPKRDWVFAILCLYFVFESLKILVTVGFGEELGVNVWYFLLSTAGYKAGVNWWNKRRKEEASPQPNSAVSANG